MAEAYLRLYCKLKNINAKIFSAGLDAHGVNPKVIEILKEDSLDISKHTSNKIDEYLNIGITHVLTVCDHANEHCPIFPKNVTATHNNFSDPTKVEGTAQTINQAFKKTRNEIKAYCKEFLTYNFKNEL
jgi:arsenate reductase